MAPWSRLIPEEMDIQIICVVMVTWKKAKEHVKRFKIVVDPATSVRYAPQCLVGIQPLPFQIKLKLVLENTSAECLNVQ